MNERWNGNAGPRSRFGELTLRTGEPHGCEEQTEIGSLGTTLPAWREAPS